MAKKKSHISPLPVNYIAERYLDLLFETGILNELELSILKPLSLEGKTIPEIAKSVGKQNWAAGKIAKVARLKTVNAFWTLQTSVKKMERILLENQLLVAEAKYFRLLNSHTFTKDLITFLATPIKEMTLPPYGLSERVKNAILRRAGSDATFVDALDFSEKEYLATRGVNKGTIEDIRAFFAKYNCDFKKVAKKKPEIKS